MSHLIEVAFKGNRKEFYLWDGDDPPKLRESIIVEGDRGEDLGRVHAVEETATHRFAGVARSLSIASVSCGAVRCASRHPMRSSAAPTCPSRTRARAARRSSA